MFSISLLDMVGMVLSEYTNSERSPMLTPLRQTSQALQNLGLTSPAVVLDPTRVETNIQEMVQKAAATDTFFRPHFKTHQSGAIGEIFRRHGVTGITVSSLAMAEYFAEFHWTDITLAFLLNPLELARIGDLAHFLHKQGGQLGLTIDSPAAAQALAEALLPVKVWIKVDTGYGRTGISWDDSQTLQATVQALGAGTSLAGILTHSGHSYQARGQDPLSAIWNTALGRMGFTRDLLERPRPMISLGDTPCCSSVSSFKGADEVRPGNFVFYDLMQLEISSCNEEQMAAATVCPVVGLYPERGQIVVQGGAVHLSREYLKGLDGQPIYGKLGLLDLANEQSPTLGPVLHEAPVVSLSQEHGVIKAPASMMDELNIGDLVLVYPVHSCLTCDLYTEYHSLDGEVIARR